MPAGGCAVTRFYAAGAGRAMQIGPCRDGPDRRQFGMVILLREYLLDRRYSGAAGAALDDDIECRIQVRAQCAGHAGMPHPALLPGRPCSIRIAHWIFARVTAAETNCAVSSACNASP